MFSKCQWVWECVYVSPKRVPLSQMTVTPKLIEKLFFTYLSCHAVMLLNSALFRTHQWWILSCYIMTSFSLPCNKALKKNPTSISNSHCFAVKIDCDESNSSNQLCSMVLSEAKFQHTYHFKIYTTHIYMYKLHKFWRATKHIFCYTNALTVKMIATKL